MLCKRYLIAEKAFSKIVIYERRKTVGGIWDYTPLPSSEGQKPAAGGGGGDSQPCFAAASPVEVVTANLPELNTPMYEGLETNLPHMLMQFADAPFPKGTQLFPKREAVMQYLDDYANDVRSLIRFEHHVVDVRPPAGGGQQGWVVTTKDAGNGGIEKAERFDAVVATNGHCDWPLLPPVEGLESWSRLLPESLHHSVSYKNPTPFKDKVSQPVPLQYYFSVTFSPKVSLAQPSAHSSWAPDPLAQTYLINSQPYANIPSSSLKLRSHLTTPKNLIRRTTQP